MSQRPRNGDFGFGFDFAFAIVTPRGMSAHLDIAGRSLPTDSPQDSVHALQIEPLGIEWPPPPQEIPVLLVLRVGHDFEILFIPRDPSRVLGRARPFPFKAEWKAVPLLGSGAPLEEDF